MFDELKERIAPDTPGFRVLCPTRWTGRDKRLKSVEDNYAVLHNLWTSVLGGSIDPDVCGVKSRMESFNFFRIRPGQLVLITLTTFQPPCRNPAFRHLKDNV